jgi:hypothetical protein
MNAALGLSGMLLLAAALAAPVEAACKQKRGRDPSFVELVVPDGAPRPAGVQDFAFVTDDTTIDQLLARVGPPDASQGSRLTIFVWCFADESELTVSTPDGVAIEQVRHDGRLIFKRGRKK